jgi:hypothetical protein
LGSGLGFGWMDRLQNHHLYTKVIYKQYYLVLVLRVFGVVLVE